MLKFMHKFEHYLMHPTVLAILSPCEVKNLYNKVSPPKIPKSKD